MRRLLLVLLASLALAAPAFATTGVNLAWDACLGTGGVNNKAFACNTNTGTEYLYVSFVSDTAIADVTGMELKLDGATCGPSVPLWWQFKAAGSCRQTALSASVVQGVEPAGCSNAWGPSWAGGILSWTTPYVGDPSYSPTFRVYLAFAVPPSELLSVTPGQETFAVRLAITHAKTVGAGACGGCETPVAFGVHRLNLTRVAPLPTVGLSTETIPGSSTVAWQGSAPGSFVPPQPPGFNDPWPYRTVSCSLPVPARNGTWGSIKSLYR